MKVTNILMVCVYVLILASTSINISMNFKIESPFTPAGDQPEAIRQLVEGIQRNDRAQTLLGVTGSGKTFTIANVIEQVQKPTLILSHNKTLVAQLYGEFKQFFPNNAVEYFVSYYDYYQPEAYVPVTGTYIEKDLAINAEIEKLRLKATSSLLSGRRDIVVVASISCIYGMGNPAEYKNNIIRISVGDAVSRNGFLRSLVGALYARTETEFERGTFRVKGDTVDIYLAYADYGMRVIFFGDEIEDLQIIEPSSGRKIEKVKDVAIFPANLYVTAKNQFTKVIHDIQDELKAQYDYFISIHKEAEAERLKERVEMDLEMIRELGYCSGIENYSRFLDQRKPGERPFCLLDYFPEDFLMVIDESHVTMPQVKAMYGGDRSRKMNLVDFGFRLPSALDNRPLNFNEFEKIVPQLVFVSATPAAYELEQTDGIFVEQIVRPTGLLDPPIEVRPSTNQVDDLIGEIHERIAVKERVLVTTLTKRMAEELSKYLARMHINCRYIHSEVDTLERVEILRDLRLGEFDVLIGVNLLREGLDLPEVSLVAILDADKEGFLRNDRSLIQTSGRAARNVNGLVIFYADKITKSMQKTIDETDRKRAKQMAFNKKHGIIPETIIKSIDGASVLDIKGKTDLNAYSEPVSTDISLAADPVVQYMTKDQLQKTVAATKKAMKVAAKKEDFMEAARLRDEMFALEQIMKERFS